MSSRGWVGLLLGLMAGLVLLGCDDLDVTNDGVRGSGNLITESRSVSGFDEIVLLGSGDVVIDVTGTESLTIEAEDNIMPLLTADLSGSRLELGSDEPFSATRGITYTITAATLDGVTINGSGNFLASGVDTGRFEVTVNGSGDVEPNGTCAEVDVNINGSGNFRGEGLVASVGDIGISGSGSAVVNVSDDLNVRISGSGSVEYLGNPVVDSQTTGSGSVSQR